MSYNKCNTCKHPPTSCSCNKYKQPSYHGHHASHGHGTIVNYNYGHQEIPPSPCVDPCDPPAKDCGPLYKNSGPARPITYGNFVSRDNCSGKVVAYSDVLVTYHNTNTKAPIWSHPSKEDKYLLPNPVKTDSLGRAQIYFSGGPVDVVVMDNCGKVIDQYTNFGGYVDDDFRLDTMELKNCIDITNPLIKIHDGDNCNSPDSLTTPESVVLQGLIDAGMPVGDWSAVVSYFCCKGETPPAGLQVYGADGCIYSLRDSEDLACLCSKEDLTDPSEYEYDEDGNSIGSDLWSNNCCCDQAQENIRLISAKAGGGVCVDVTADPGIEFVWQSRDGQIIEGAATVNNIGSGGVGALVATVTNDLGSRALLSLSFQGIADCYRSPIGDESIVWTLSDTELESFPTRDDVANGSTNEKGYLINSIPDQFSLINSFDEESRMATSSTQLEIEMEIGETRTFYGQFWFVGRNVTGGTQVFHGNMVLRGVLQGGLI